jgi:lipopolysaccharide cholinephosphotransferase
MGFMHTLKSLLPVSSRSFHAFETNVGEQLTLLSKESGAGDPRTQMRFWALYQREGESLADAKKRFFLALPKASGQMRLLQDAQAKILRELHTLCEQLGIHYLATGGTLIGARRHQGFIPWDDDLDVAISRDDFKVLQHALESSDTHRISIVWDYVGACEQVRFQLRDLNNPSFVDLFVFDWTSDPTAAMYQKSQSYRARLKEEVISKFSLSKWAEVGSLDDSDPFAAQVRELFDKWRSAESHESYAVDREHALGMYRGIESFDDPTHYPYVGTMDDWFPAQEMTFEGFTVWAPHNDDKYLSGPYGDIWELPADITSHPDHISRKLLENPEVYDSLQRYIAEK